MPDIVLLTDDANTLSAKSDVAVFPNTTDTIWSKLSSLPKPSELKGGWDKAVKIEAITVKLGEATQVFRLPEGSEPFVPGLIFSLKEGTPPQLLTTQEISNDIGKISEALKAKGKTAADEAEAHARECWVLAKEALKRELRRRKFTFGETGFLGIKDVGAAVTSAQLALMIDGAVLLGETSDEIEVLRASLSFSAAASLSGGISGVVDARLELVITANPQSFANATAEFLSSFDLPQLPNIPRPRLRFPMVELPSLSLEGVNRPDLDADFLDFDLKLPGFRPAPVQVVWTTRPAYHVTQLSPLNITIGPGQGTLRSANGADLATLTGILLSYDGGTGKFTVAGKVGSMTNPIERNLDEVVGFDLGGRLPVTIDISEAKTTVTTGAGFDLSDPGSTAHADPNANAQAKLTLGRIVVRSKEDPHLFIAFAAELEASAVAVVGGNPTGGMRLTSLKVIEPYPVELIYAASTTAIEGVLRLVAMIKLPKTTVPDVPELPVPDLSNLMRVVDRLSDLLVSALKWMAREAGEAGAALSQLAEAGIEALGGLIRMLRDAADSVLSHVVIEVRLDAETYHLRQVLISPVSLGQVVTSGNYETKAYGVEITVPRTWRPSMLIDVSGPFFAALLVEPSGEPLTIATDLWLDRDGASPQSAADTDGKTGQRPAKRLIELKATKAADRTLALVVVDSGQVSYFQVLASNGGLGSEPLNVPGLQSQPRIPIVRERPALRSINFNKDVDGDVKIDFTSVERLLPFFDTPAIKLGGSGGFDKFGQYVKVTGADKAELNGSTATVPVKVELKIDDLKTDAKLKLTLDLSTLSARVTGGDAFVIRGERKHGTMFGLEYVILPRNEKTQGDFNQFLLDLSGGNPRMALHPDAEVKLFYRRLGGEGRGLAFRVDDFAIAKSGFDLIARVDPDEPVTLPGVDMPFRFADGQLVVKNGRILAFSITGTGQLPPELVGEASCKVKIMLGPNAVNDLAVLSCDAELDKTDDPIVCQGTRFTLTIAKLGFAVQDFRTEGGYQFYFLVTGTIVFTPPGDEFGKTFLKYLRGAKLTLNKAPLGRDMRLLARSIEIQVPLNPKVNFNLFEVFAFEVRGFGFHPASPAFNGSPALNISGQARFREVGDVISAKIDCHSLWMAPPAPGAALPRVRFDGLTVALSLNGAGSIEGTALTVDENLPTLERPFQLPSGITASGFLASGQLKLSGWAPMTASMGFLELKEKDEPRHSFYLYGQMEKLSVPIPTPIKEIYLREAGFGFGYRYTLAGIARADQVTTPAELIRVLDDVSRYQGDLAKFSSWQPEFNGSRITLAMRALATVESPYKSSEEMRLEEKKLEEEKKVKDKKLKGSDSKSREDGFPNPLLFDMAAALRSDLTLLMTARAWFSVNYDTWTKKKDEISTKPPLRGYLYLSAPRKELLARLVSDPDGYIGDTPKLPNELVEAFRSVRYASTLYIRPGLFHFEFGWPYELKLTVPREPNQNFGLTAEGGLVFRVEDFSLLYGIAIRARGFAQFGGSVGGSSLGASALAHADFSLDAKFIAYLALERVSETLFYGCLAFSCNLSFEIKFWVEIDLGFDSIRLSASFSQSYAISAALELAIGPSVLAGRAAVAISVGAFGRSLTLSVGFGFNEGALVDARHKVERFLALGLTSAVPDPAAGLAPPPAAPPTKADALDKRADEAATLGQIENQPPSAPEKPFDIEIREKQFKGKTFTPNTPLFWAMLFEISAKPGTYVLQLVPRDATQAFVKEEDKKNMDLATIGGTRSTFYGPAGTKFKVTDLGGKTIKRLLETGDEETVEDQAVIGPQLETKVAKSGDSNSDRTLTLREVLDEVYLASKVTYDPTRKRITERVKRADGKNDVVDVVPETIRIDGAKARTQAAAEAELAAAADASANLSVARALLRGVEEKRSALISAICSSAERIAREATLDATGNLVWPKRPKPTPDGVIDARDFGLTFVVSEGLEPDGMDDTLSGLFIDGGGKLPPMAAFKVQLVDEWGNPIERDVAQPVRLFNPPSRFFDRANPRLARFTGIYDSRGVVLDWDLEPAWEGSANVWHDPEFHLKTYRIQRVFKVDGGPTSKLKPLETTTKAAAPLKPVVNENGAVEWQKITPPVQFVDDFNDLPEDLRPALLRATSTVPADQKTPVEAWDKLVTRLSVTGGRSKVELVYTIQAIDIAGREGVPVPFEISIEAPTAVVPRIAQAELFVAYDKLPGASKDATKVTLALRVDDLLDADPKDRNRTQLLAPDGTAYLLRIRRETSTPIGIYGADAVTTALKRPTPDQFETKLSEKIDTDVVVKLNWGSSAPKATDKKESEAYAQKYALNEINIGKQDVMEPRFEVTNGTIENLQNALGIDLEAKLAEPRSVRVAIHRAVKDKNGKFVPDGSDWLVVDTHLRICVPEADELRLPRPVDTVVETFESPKAVGFELLHFRDLAGEAGRLLVDYPCAGSTLDALVTEKGKVLQRLRDGDRRVATRVRWNAVPSPTSENIDNGSPCLIGGYDVFEADLTASLTRDDIVSVAEPIARVTALDPLTAAGEPATIEDYGAIEAFYPSETLRLSKREGAARRRAWFSPAESLGVWPEVGIRRSVGLTIPDAEVAQLFTRGAPTSVVVRFEGANKTPATSSAEVLTAVLTEIAKELGKKPDELAPVGLMVNCDPTNNALHGVKPSGLRCFGGGGTEFYPPDQTKSTFENVTLRRLLHCLVIDTSNPQDWWNDPLRKDFDKHRAALRGLTIEIEAKRGDVSLHTITHKIDLDTALHPVLGDVLDAVRWHDGEKLEKDKGSFYRRYEPVIDPAPPTDATTIDQFLDQRPIERDPYGWAILRTLGLAAGFRLSDTLSGDFVLPAKAIVLVRDAFATILPRYRSGDRELLQLGQPFVDLMTRAGGLYTVASFDGGDTALGKDFLDNELVSLVQIALRPVAEALVNNKPLGARYYTLSLKKTPPEGASVDYTINMSGKDAKGLDGLVDLKFLDTGLSKSAVMAFAYAGDEGREKLIDRLSGGRPTEVKRTFTIPASMLKNEQPFAFLRVTWPNVSKSNWKKLLKEVTGENFVIARVRTPRVIGKCANLEAFERFPELPPTAITELLSSKDSNASCRFNRFLTLAKARFGTDGVPKLDAPAELDTFFVRWPDLMRRFFTHGPSALLEAGSLEVPFSLALMPRSMPLRSKVQDDGTMEMVVVHKDRLARRRRYFVRPFSRYDNITAAWHTTYPMDIPWAGRRSLADSIKEYQDNQDKRNNNGKAIHLPSIELGKIDDYSLDIIVPRSEPLAPPVVLSARRLDVGEGTDQRPGKLIEFVVARHQEEIASESNITVADSLQFEHLAFGFYREFRDIAWAKMLRGIAGWKEEELDLLPEVMSQSAFDAKPLSFNNKITPFGEEGRKSLPERLPDGWRGITALRTEDVPHFYRVHAVVFAAAGVVVSEPVVATVPEGEFTLSSCPRKGKPVWSVTEGNGDFCVSIETPLIRYLDGMTDEQATWLNSLASEKHRVYNLPDPSVAYEIATVGKGGDAVIEVAFVAQPGERQADEKGLFLTTWPGTRFETTNADTPTNLLPPDSDGMKGWRIELPLKPRSRPVSQNPDQPFLKAIKPFLGFAGSFEMASDSDWAAFAPFAPRADSWIMFRRPDVVFVPPSPPISPPVPQFKDAESQQMGREAETIRARLQAIKDANGVSTVIGTGWDRALDTLAKVAEFRNLSGLVAYQGWRALMDGDQSSYRVDLPRFAGIPNWPASTTYVEMAGIDNVPWILDRPTDVSFAKRAPAVAAMRRSTAIPADKTGEKNKNTFRIGLFAALWWEDRADVLRANQQSLSAYPMVTGAIPLDPDPVDLRKVAKDYVALFTDTGSTLKPSPSLEFLSRLDVTLDDPTKLDAFRKLLDHLTTHELYPGKPSVGYGSAVEAMQGIEIGETTRAELLLPSVAFGKIVELINTITGAAATPFDHGRPIALTLRRPPIDKEVTHVKDAQIKYADKLHKFVNDLAMDQIFGAGRVPRIKATKGFLDALYQDITRKEG
jgi:hypothetical protein